MTPLAILLLALWLPGTARAQAPGACDDVSLWLGALRQDLDEARLEKALALGRQLEEKLVCQPRAVNPVTLASLYQLLGAVSYFANDAASADYYWSVALATSPASALDPSLGQGAGAVFEKVRARVLAEKAAQVRVAPRVVVWLDGRRVVDDLPQDVPAGLHLLQREESGGALTGQMVQLAPGTRYEVQAGDALIGMVGTTSAVPAPSGALAAVAPPAPRDLPWGRLALNGAVTGAGLGLGIAAIYNYTQASEAYHDYLWIRDEERANAVYDEEFRPRGGALIAEGVGSLALLGTGAALWATTDGLDRDGRPWRRLLLDGAVVAAGAGLGAASIYNYAQTSAAYDDHLAEPDPDRAADIYDLEVRPRRGLAAAEGLGSLALLGVGTTLLLTTDLQVTIQPGAVSAAARW